MNNNFGFIHDKLEIKLLILFLLHRIPEGIDYDTLAELTMFDDGIGYFDFSESVSELISNGQLAYKNNRYSITAKGKKNSDITEMHLPFSVRQEAEKRAGKLRAKQNRNSMISTSHSEITKDGSKVRLSLSDGACEILSLEILASNEKQALALEKGFRDNAESIYTSLIELILD